VYVDSTSTSKRYIYKKIQAFSDSVKGWGVYNGELRHNSNSTGPKYGTQLSSNDIIGVALDMVEGTMSFYRNNEYWGIAYKD
jgi:hypothetical protein